MVKLDVRAEHEQKSAPPSIFNAARSDDPLELAAAVKAGQTLNDVEGGPARMTAMHLACVSRSEKFLAEAVKLEFDPWIRDASMRLAIDYAFVCELKEAERAFLTAMYPEGWTDDPDSPQAGPV